MKTTDKILIVAALGVVVAVVMALSKGPATARHHADSADPGAAVSTPATVATTTPATAPQPTLLDLGADKCIPCKMMAPILEELRQEYAGRMNVTFIDVWKNPDAAKPYGIQMIPTQIFMNADGRELYRHTGFFSKDDILAKWKELGVDVTGKATTSPSPQPETK